MSYRPWERKTLQKERRKTTKKWIGALTESYRERKSWKLLKKWVWTRENQFLKNSLHDFRSIEKQIQSVENASIDLESIEHRSKHTKPNQNFNHNFDRSKNTFCRSKFWEKQFFENQSKILQKLLKALNFINKMHEYEMKCFSKTLVLNPVFPKIRLLDNSP